MRRMTSFDYHKPRSLGEASSILLEGGDRAMALAGGTDLLIRLKRAMHRADVVIDLGAIEELRRVDETAEGLRIGAMTTAGELAANKTARRYFPAVSEAASLVGGLQIRNMATLGGALCSGLRCQLMDQSAFWRSTLGPCVRRGGETCHAQPGDRCVATVASDFPPALVASSGRVNISGPQGNRSLPVEELFSGDGSHPVQLAQGELVTDVVIPWSRSAPHWAGYYRKVRLRRAVDRPLVGLALSLKLSAESELQQIRVAACGNGPSCSLVPGLEPFLSSRLDEAVADAIGRHVSRWFDPSPAIRVDIGWRRTMAGVMARRTLLAALNAQPRRAKKDQSIGVALEGRS